MGLWDYVRNSNSTLFLLKSEPLFPHRPQSVSHCPHQRNSWQTRVDHAALPPAQRSSGQSEGEITPCNLPRPKQTRPREGPAAARTQSARGFSHVFVALHLSRRYYNSCLSSQRVHSRCSFPRVGRRRTTTWASSTTSSRGLFPRRWIRSRWSRPTSASPTWTTSSAKRQVDHPQRPVSGVVCTETDFRKTLSERKQVFSKIPV